MDIPDLHLPLLGSGLATFQLHLSTYIHIGPVGKWLFVDYLVDKNKISALHCTIDMSCGWQVASNG